MMCVDIMRGKDVIADDAWLLFLRGLPPLEKEREPLPPGREWLTEDLWNKVQDPMLGTYLASLKVYFQRNPHCYKLICDVGQNRHSLLEKDTALVMQAMVSSCP